MISHNELLVDLVYDPETGYFFSDGRRIDTKIGHGYRAVVIKGTQYRAHRLAWFYMTGIWPPDDVDHIDGRKDHNAFANLRLASRSQNIAYSRLSKASTTGLKGVSFDKRRGKFQAGIKINYRRIALGRFDTPQEAHAAYLAAARQHFGEFANGG